MLNICEKTPTCSMGPSEPKGLSSSLQIDPISAITSLLKVLSWRLNVEALCTSVFLFSRHTCCFHACSFDCYKLSVITAEVGTSFHSDEVARMTMNTVFRVDLTKIDGLGDFPCPACGAIISPDDESEESYSILEARSVGGDLLDEILIQCNGCKSTISIVGFDKLYEE